MKKLILAVALAALAAPASATLQLAANINGVLFTCVDQAACDTNAAVGQLSIANTTFAGVEILGSSQTAVSGPTNFLNTSSFQFINHNTSAVNVTLAIGGTNFLSPVSSYAASGSGTWQNANGSSATLTYYGDPTNTQGADTPTDLPGTLLASFSDVAVGLADAFSFNQAGAFAALGAHSLSLGTTGTLAAWNGVAGQEATLVGRSQAIITQSVPEPGSLALLGAALFGFGFIRKRS